MVKSIVIPDIKDTGKAITNANIKPVIKYKKVTLKRGKDYIVDDFTLIVSDTKYTGKTAKPKIKLIDNVTGKTISNKCYTVKYENGVYISDSAPKIILTGKGSYEGTIEKHFRIYEKSIAKVYVDKIPNQVYTGSKVVPKGMSWYIN